MCGAAALVMAYRQCGIEVDQNELWDDIAHEHNGNRRAHTHHMAADALKRGLVAVIMQTHQPWRLLEQCYRNNISVVINHRIHSTTDEGHYSLLTGISYESVTIHDPLVGPNCQYDLNEFQTLWLPKSVSSEIAGNVLIAIARRDEQPSIWSHCNNPFEEALRCQNCQFPIPLKPARALGCWKQDCRERFWWKLFCPRCDYPHQKLS